MVSIADHADDDQECLVSTKKKTTSHSNYKCVNFKLPITHHMDYRKSVNRHFCSRIVVIS